MELGDAPFVPNRGFGAWKFSCTALVSVLCGFVSLPTSTILLFVTVWQHGGGKKFTSATAEAKTPFAPQTHTPGLRGTAGHYGKEAAVQPGNSFP